LPQRRSLVDFKTKLEKIQKKNNSLLCVGLDPELTKIPGSFKKQKNPLFEFCKSIIDGTANLVSAYKPNIAFYEAYGLEGLSQLKLIIDYLKSNHPNIPIILDAKRADVPNTAKMYAKAIYEYWGVDATTVYPHLGLDSLEPFFRYKDKLTILLVKTSNPNSGMFQNINTSGEPFYRKMSKIISAWKNKNYGILVGATYPKELKQLRSIFPDRIFLSPGIGAQEGNLKESVKAGIDKNKRGIIFNASRSIIYAQDPQKSAKKLRDEINTYR
jgi:orotidine 5'-phosphate decarboxylase subfamily 2